MRIDARLLRALALLLASVWADAVLSAELPANDLKDHPAPYLALHGEDPVKWQQWNAKTVEYARQHNKILFLSVGYFACHWCHVMQQESYRNPEVASLLNTHFVPVKIDRELEPALDRQLIDFARKNDGRAGWPLNVFLTPNGNPFHSAVYMPRDHFIHVLTQLRDLWAADHQRIVTLATAEAQPTFAETEPKLDAARGRQLLKEAALGVMSGADLLSGGFGEQKKFVWVPQLRFLLAAYRQAPDAQIEEFLRTTLDAMGQLGLRDHLGGGFFRYTIDPDWATPHFEKMLNDNALIALLFLEAASVLNQPSYTSIAINTLDFLQREMIGESGAFVASLSAVDDQGVEGGSYLWTADQVTALLDVDELELVSRVWGLDKANDFPQGKHLRLIRPLADVAQSMDLDLPLAIKQYESARLKLFAARASRVIPVDTKILAGWNGLALSAFSRAAQQTGLARFRQTALRLKNHLVNRHWDGQGLARAVVNDKTLGSASLEDYAYVTQGLLNWADLSGNDADFTVAQAIIDQAWARFYQNNGWRQSHQALLADPGAVEVMADSVMPSPAALVIANTLRLPKAFALSARSEQALSALNRGQEILRESPFWYVSQLRAMAVALNRAPVPRQENQQWP